MVIEERTQLLSAYLRRVHREVNLLWYTPSTLLVEKDGARELGAVRYALREDPVLRYGLIADLSVDPEMPHDDRRQTETELIGACEKELQQHKVVKIDAVVLDGEGRTIPFQNAGYWPFRKTVVIEWDLKRLPHYSVGEFRIDEPNKLDVPLLVNFILHSYQPYFQWWQEERLEKPWLRTDLPESDPTEVTAKLGERNRASLEKMLQGVNPEQHVFFFAYKGGELLGMCDAKISDDDNFDFGVLVKYGAGGKGIGTALMGNALAWLKSKGSKRARVITTSGMDDYDPTVYLYTQAMGGKMKAEYLDLVKKI